MKTILITLVSIIMWAGMMAQDEQKSPILSGKVIYKDVQKMDIQLEGDAAEFAHMLPKERSSMKSLTFNKKASLYENFKGEESEGGTHMDESEGMMVQVQMVEPENKTYVDFNARKAIEQREFMSRTFLIEKELSNIKWKISGEQKNILGYPCTEAVCTNSQGEIVKAWFAPQIPLSAGPDTLYNLPGLIMELDISDGDRMITATSIEETSQDKIELKKPKKGKKVSYAEYKEIVDEKMKEMGIESTEGVHTVVEIKRQ